MTATPATQAEPRWLRLADALIAIAAILFLSAWLFDGVRVRFGDLRLSATSPMRLGLILVVLVGGRHAVVRRPSWVGRFRERLARFWTSDERRAAWPVFWTTRASVLVAAYFAAVLIGFPPGNHPRISEHEWNNLPARWDAMWYLSVAEDGYVLRGPAGESNLAFFPAYPLLLRAGGALLGVRPGAPSDPTVSVGEFLTARRTRLLRAGLVISLWAFFQALVYLHRLGRELVGAVPARHALLLLASFPFAFFFSAAYAESLFLLAAVGAFYHFHQQEWGRAALWGLLVGLSRPNGCLVSVPLAVLALSLARKSPAAEVDPPTNEPVETRRLIPALLVAATPGVGMLAYTAWLRLAGGRWFMWMDAQAAWGREFHGIGWSLATFHRFLTSAPLYELTRYWPTETLDGIAAFGALALSWPIARRLGLAYGLLVPLTLVPPLFTGGFMSLGRMTATLFPLFLYLGWRLPDEARRQWVIVSLLLQGALAAIHFTWRPLV